MLTHTFTLVNISIIILANNDLIFITEMNNEREKIGLGVFLGFEVRFLP